MRRSLVVVGGACACVLGLGACGVEEETTKTAGAGTGAAAARDAGTNTGAGGSADEGPACDTAGGLVYISPAGGKCDLEVIKKVPGCNEKACDKCEVPLNCLPVCCSCDDGKTQYAATGCHKTSDAGPGKCMTKEDVCNDPISRTQGCGK